MGQPNRRRRGQRTRLLTRALPLLVLVLVVVAVVVVVLSDSGNGERTLARRYLSDWANQDYVGMYGMLSAGSKSNLTEAQFKAGYADAVATATQTGLHIGLRLEIRNNVAQAPATIRTRTFGTLHETARVQLSSSGKYVVYSPDMVFPGLRPGETLTRTSTLGTRGNLLASNGQILAQGSTLATQISTAGLIVGVLGDIPASQRAYYDKLGYPPDAQVGQYGLEDVFQTQLAGIPGGILKAGTRVLASVAPTNGTSVKTTINPTLEADANTALANTYSGMIVLNEKTGGIEAAVGLAFTDIQPPGSTFKMVTATAALQYGVAKLDTTYPYASSADIGGYTLQNAAGETCGGTLINAFASSCNSTYAPLGIQIGPQRLLKTAELYGFNQSPGIATALVSQVPPDITTAGPTAVGSAAIGQWQVEASPLEMADVAATIADGGKRPLPTFDATAKPKFVSVTTPKVAGELQQMMIAVTTYPDGTAAADQIPGYTVAGKTGTAELGNTANQANDAKETDAWYVAYVPGKSNLVVCALFPSDGYGADTAAPAVNQVLEAALGVS